MRYSFFAYGHENIRATHKNTLEFTKEKDLSPSGDCICGVRSTFDPMKARPLLKCQLLHVTISFSHHVLSFTAIPNPSFSADEMVFRRGDFLSDRTIGTRATKACNDIPRDLVPILRDPKTKIEVSIDEAPIQE